MANEPAPGSKSFPSARSGASDDDIFAEMGRMLAQDQLGAAPAKPRPAKPATAAAGEDAPLELTHVVKPGKPQMAPQPAAAAAPVTPSPPAPPVAPPVAAPSQGTKIGEAVAMLDGQPKAAAGVTVSNRSLDALVQDMVRPMIQEWINQNMERIVREEAAKAVAKAAPNT